MSKIRHCGCCDCGKCDKTYCTEYSEYYSTYHGPELVRATLDNEDCLIKMKKIYREGNNWDSKIWIARDVFGDDCVGKEFYFGFRSKNGRDHYYKGIIDKHDTVINPPAYTPFDEKYNRPNDNPADEQQEHNDSGKTMPKQTAGLISLAALGKHDLFLMADI